MGSGGILRNTVMASKDRSMEKMLKKYSGILFMFLSLFFVNAVFGQEASQKIDEKQIVKVMRELDSFFASKRKNDQYAIAKEEKVRDVIPMVIKNAPADQWMDYFTFYYESLNALDKAGKFMTPELKRALSPDPEALLGRYIDEERKLAAANLFKPQEEKDLALIKRFDELAKARQAYHMRLDEMTGRMYTAAFVYAPSQEKLLDLLRERITLASRLRLGEISVKEYDKTWSEMTKRYLSENKGSLRL